jgi:hypothetical protein
MSRASTQRCTLHASAAAVNGPGTVELLLHQCLRMLLLQVSPREYLETALSPTAGAGAATEAKNQVRLLAEKQQRGQHVRAHVRYMSCSMLGVQQQP